MAYEPPKFYTLESSDGHRIQISHAAIIFIDSFKVIPIMYKLFQDETYPIPVKGSILQKIVEFCETRQKLLDAKNEMDLAEINEFVLPQDQLKEIVEAAILLQVQGI